MNFDQAKDTALMGMLTVIGGYIALQIREMTQSVHDLNVRIAQVVEMVAHHKEQLGEHATRIRQLEKKEI